MAAIWQSEKFKGVWILSVPTVYSKWTYFPEGQQFTKNVFFNWSYEVIIIFWVGELVGFC